LDEVELATGADVFTDTIGDFSPDAARWRLYGMALLAVGGAYAKPKRREIDQQIEEMLRPTWIGALWYALREPPTRERAASRIDALLSRWNDLATLRYHHRELHSQRLEELVELSFGRFLQLWAADGELRTRLQSASIRALSASDEEARERLAVLLGKIAANNRRVVAPERFRDKEWLVAQLLTIPPDLFEAAISGDRPERALFAIVNTPGTDRT
jgi:hypothetical protein